MEEFVNKKRNTKKILLITINAVIVVLIISFILLFRSEKPNPVKDVVQNIIDSVTNNEDDEILFPPEEKLGGGGGGSGGGGSGGGGASSGGGGGSGDGSSNCYTQEISYYILNVNKQEICNSYNGTICIDKTVSCSAEIHNEDFSISGNFHFMLSIVAIGENKDNSVKNFESTFSIAPQMFAVFEDSVNLQSSEENGPANKEYNCFYNSVEVPLATVCT